MEEEFLLLIFSKYPVLWKYYSEIVRLYIIWKLEKLEKENDKKD